MWEQILAAALLAGLLASVLRLALGLRAAKLDRERALHAERQAGRTVVAELPRTDGSVGLFVEEARAFRWDAERVSRSDVRAVRLLLNGAVVAELARPGFRLPPPGGAEAFEGGERWEVRIYAEGGWWDVACGSLREGISRGVGRAVFEAVRAAVEERSP